MDQICIGRHLLQHLLDAQVYPVSAISFEKTICRRLLLRRFSQLQNTFNNIYNVVMHVT
jgi:hypothetical protein